MYEGGDGSSLYRYVRDVAHAVLERLAILNISDYMDKGLMSALVKPGRFVLIQGAHSFSRKPRLSRQHQPAIGVRRVNKVRVEFTLNLWETTSSSAKGIWLTGRNSVASVMRVIRLERKAKEIILRGSVLAIAQELEGLKSREYSTAYFRRGVHFADFSGEDEEESDEDDVWSSNGGP